MGGAEETANGRAWRCVVCGYVHRGDAPPQYCVVCGAGPDQFEPHQDPPPLPTPPKQWRCIVCGYVHEGDAPPDTCPVCNAGADQFELAPDEPAVEPAQGEPLRIVVVGGGVAAVSAAEAARKTSPWAEVVILSAEDHLPYYRINLSRYLAAEIGREDLPIHPETWYREQRLQWRPAARVTALDRDSRTVRLEHGAVEPYDRLILAVGAEPFVPPIPGIDRPEVMVLRTLEDADALLATAGPGRNVVCIGGGLLGLEAAAGLARRGATVTVLESGPWLMPRQLDRRAAELLADQVRGLGIALRTDARTASIDGEGRLTGVSLDDGTALPADLVLVATGVRSSIRLARDAGLEVNRGVVVDDGLRSSDGAIYAAGDVAEHRGVVYGTWTPAQYQGAIAGANAAGADQEFGGLPPANALKVLNTDLFSIGRVTAEPEDTVIAGEDADANCYRRFLFRDGRMAGAVLLGDTASSFAAKRAIEGGEDFSDLLAETPTLRRVLDYLTS